MVNVEKKSYRHRQEYLELGNEQVSRIYSDKILMIKSRNRREKLSLENSKLKCPQVYSVSASCIRQLIMVHFTSSEFIAISTFMDSSLSQFGLIILDVRDKFTTV